MDFQVHLPVFRGPLDLLLYLVRKHEVEIVDIPIAPIADQFIEYLAVLEQLDLGTVGEFVEMASTLLEIKSRLVLPHGDEEESALADPREELVHRLLEYKKYKDAASMLEERGRGWKDHFSRAADDLPPRERDLAAEEIREVELWDLVSAFGRIVRDSQAARPSNIVYDDTPIHVYMAEIQARLLQQGQLTFRELFQPGMHRSALVGIFLAVLELVRHNRVRTEQNDLFGELWILPGQAAAAPLDAAEIDNYDHGQTRSARTDHNSPGRANRDLSD
ncbi:MAG TPA: segregation/condensation protein A [Pirellulales bacterium]|nr:segregation/condensation protein A [Pirellulales bacterium]